MLGQLNLNEPFRTFIEIAKYAQLNLYLVLKACTLNAAGMDIRKESYPYMPHDNTLLKCDKQDPVAPQFLGIPLDNMSHNEGSIDHVWAHTFGMTLIPFVIILSQMCRYCPL